MYSINCDWLERERENKRWWLQRSAVVIKEQSIRIGRFWRRFFVRLHTRPVKNMSLRAQDCVPVESDWYTAGRLRRYVRPSLSGALEFSRLYVYVCSTYGRVWVHARVTSFQTSFTWTQPIPLSFSRSDDLRLSFWLICLFCFAISLFNLALFFSSEPRNNLDLSYFNATDNF